MRLLLDTAVVGEICHPRKYDDVRAWFARAVRTRAPCFRWRAHRRAAARQVAAQALAEDAVIVTPKARHFDSMVRAVTWQEV